MITIKDRIDRIMEAGEEAEAEATIVVTVGIVPLVTEQF